MRLAIAACVLIAAGCHDREPAATPVVMPLAEDHEAALAKLRAFEDQRRGTADFAALPSSDRVLGPEPYRIAAHADGYVGLLRNANAIVSLDAHGRELARVPAPRSPTGLAVDGDDVLVVGELGREVARYRFVDGQLTRTAGVPIDAIGLRDVVFAPDHKSAYLVEEHDGRLLELRGAEARELGRCHGASQVAAVENVVAVNCLLDHTIELYRPGQPVARIHHDGPLWRFALHAAPHGVLIAASGVEDHPLEREDGGFGYIDSFVYLYGLAPGDARPTRYTAINTSELGVVTPKWLALRTAGGEVRITTAGYASPTAVTLTWHGDYAVAPAIARTSLLPGTADAQLAADGTLITANPLFDAWVTSGDPPGIVSVADPSSTRTPLSKLGELLFFTTAMAPWNSSDGKLSRFTCETCHHEGYVDGRTHFTGRGDVHATTKPLYGLFNNRPYFSRALDKTMTQMVHAEFRVANRHNGRDPWFALTRAELPWLAQITGAPAELTAPILREAFMSFLMDFTHRPNPAADHARFTPAERAGAAVFRDHCAGCHAARLNADDPASLVPFERWESLVLSASGPIVWSNAEYARTQVVPYVGDRGARVPALRRLYKKWPYFTNGQARSIADVLDRFGELDGAADHDLAPSSARRLTADDKAALRAFLDLL